MSNNMQDQWDDFDDDFDLDDEPVQKPQGNDLVKQLRKADREKAKKLAALEAELDALRAERRSFTVSQILESEGVPTKIAKFIPADITEAEAVKAWLDENADVFGFNRSSDGEPSPDERALRQMNNVAAGALSPSQIDDIYSQIDRAESPEEVAALLAQLG